MSLAPTAFVEWFKLCAANDEFVGNYNRLRKTRISFAIPHRTPFDRMIDAATKHVPMPQNDPAELSAFVLFCMDMFLRLPSPETASA